MCTKTQLTEFLKELSQEAIFPVFNYDCPVKYQVMIKCKVNLNENEDYYNEYVENWINRFSVFTNTGWVVRPCPSHAARFTFRKCYSCHRTAQNKSQTSSCSGNLKCEAIIYFKVMSLIRDALSNDADLNSGFNLTIQINFDHNHLITHKSLNLVRSLSNSDSLFFEYFDDGYWPANAKVYHDLLLKEIYGEDSEKLDNASPTLRHVEKLFMEWREKKIKLDMNEVLKRKVETLGTQGYTARYSRDKFVVIVTPLMKRIITQLGVKKVLIDATLEPGVPFTLILYVPSVIGSLPVAYVIFANETEDIYRQIFLTIKLAIEKGCYTVFAPNLLLHDDHIEIKQALRELFPQAVLKLNRYSLCRDMWRLICFHQLDTTLVADQRNLMSLFKDMIFATSVNDAKTIYNTICCNTVGAVWHNKLEAIWNAHVQWLDSGSSDWFTGIPIAFLKEFILQLCRPFHGFMPGMVDVVSNVLEPHYNKILLSHRDGNTTSVYTKFLAKVKFTENSVALAVNVDNRTEYRLQDQIDKDCYYQLSTETMCCNCKLGQTGRACEHLCGVLNVFDKAFVLTSSIQNNFRIIFQKIMEDIAPPFNRHELQETDTVAMDEEMPIYEAHVTTLNEDDDPLADTNDDNAFDRENSTSPDFNRQYDEGIEALHEEFKRLNRLFTDNPNQTNLYTMQQLAKELRKIVVINESEMGNALEESTSADETGER